MNCLDSIEPTYFFFTEKVPPLLYYSHIPPTLIAMLLCFLIIKNGMHIKSLKLLILLLSNFIILSITNLIIWTNINVSIISISWVITQLSYLLLPLSSLEFYYAFSNKESRSSVLHRILIMLVVGIFITMIIYNQNIQFFDIVNCEVSESPLFYYYQNAVLILCTILIIISAIKKYYSKDISATTKKQILIISSGLILLLITLFSSWNSDLFNYSTEIEQFGFIGMIVFLSSLAYSIVRFKSFNIKLLGAQALVWSIGLLVGSQFFFVDSSASIILTIITLLIIVVAGYILVESVKKVDEQKELLEIANKNQMILVRFITHQVKGFFTKSKAIFAGLMEGDFGETTQPIKDVARAGLDSDNNAVEMISEILNASNLRNGQTVYSFETINFSEFTNTITNSFKTRASDKNLSLDVQVPEKPLMAKMDKMQMTQVVKNLIDNAINYTPTGKVSVILKETTHEKVKFIQLAVTDSGVGLTDKDKSVLFREGGHGDESLKVNVNSTGYGLFIVKKIVEGHNGTIVASSAGRNKGSTFTVELPEVIE